jgi:citrate lyase subunit beta / citryl-CoA lyase
MTDRVKVARSLLFAPGHRPERFEKAARSGADVVVLDLEDGVPPAEKPRARAAIEQEWARLQATGVPLVVRINSAVSAEGREDLAWLQRLDSPAAVMLPKAESAQMLALVQEHLPGTALLPIIETAIGYTALTSLAAARGVLRLVIGHIDFMADTGLQCEAEQSELAPLRFAVAIATRVHQLAPAVDGVTVEVGNDERLREDVRRAVRWGFGGKLCIHPQQIGVVHQAIAPTEQELQWARKVLAASVAAGGAAVLVDGRMVDLPVVLQAQRTLARAAAVARNLIRDFPSSR